MGKQKGRFRKGKYVKLGRKMHIKARRDKGSHLDLTIRMTEDEVRNVLVPQIKKYLDEVDRQASAKQRKTPKT